MLGGTTVINIKPSAWQTWLVTYRNHFLQAIIGATLAFLPEGIQLVHGYTQQCGYLKPLTGHSQ